MKQELSKVFSTALKGVWLRGNADKGYDMIGHGSLAEREESNERCQHC